MSKQPKPKKTAIETPLIPEPEFEDALKTILSTTKQDSDRQMEEFQDSNKVKRERRRDQP